MQAILNQKELNMEIERLEALLAHQELEYQFSSSQTGATWRKKIEETTYNLFLLREQQLEAA